MIEFDSNTAEFKKRHIAEPEQNWKAPQKMKCPKVVRSRMHRIYTLGWAHMNSAYTSDTFQ